MNTPESYRFLLVCRACGWQVEKVLTQFSELPACLECGSEMLLENAIKENDNGNSTENFE